MVKVYGIMLVMWSSIIVLYALTFKRSRHEKHTDKWWSENGWPSRESKPLINFEEWKKNRL